MKELDGIYNGAASQSYTGEFIIKNWGQEINTMGTWTDPAEVCPDDLKISPEDKVYFARATFGAVFDSMIQLIYVVPYKPLYDMDMMW